MSEAEDRRYQFMAERYGVAKPTSTNRITNPVSGTDYSGIMARRQQSLEFSRQVLTNAGVRIPTAADAEAAREAAAVAEDEFNPYTYFRGILQNYGLGDLYQDIENSLSQVPEGNNEAAWEIIRQTPQYQRKFIGNQRRIEAGLLPLSEEEYLATRDAFRKVMRNFGMSTDRLFTNSQGEAISEDEAFGVLVGGDVSPTEFAERLRIADDWTKSADPATKEALRTFYGVEDEDLMAYALNPEGGQAVLRRRAAEVQAASQAIESGFDVFSTATIQPDSELSRQYLGELATRGLPKDATPQEIARATGIAEEAIARAGEQRATFERLSDISGANLTAEEQVEAQVAGVTGLRSDSDAAARGKIERLRSQERARFGGAGAGPNIFGSEESGSF